MYRKYQQINFGCNFTALWSHKYFGHPCDHLQSGDNKNANITKMSLNHCTL